MGGSEGCARDMLSADELGEGPGRSTAFGIMEDSTYNDCKSLCRAVKRCRLSFSFATVSSLFQCGEEGVLGSVVRVLVRFMDKGSNKDE